MEPKFKLGLSDPTSLILNSSSITELWPSKKRQPETRIEQTTRRDGLRNWTALGPWERSVPRTVQWEQHEERGLRQESERSHRPA